MKFDFSVIQDPIPENAVCNSVTGKLPTGEIITVSRHANHWAVNLKITVNDFVWHDSPALQPEQRAFDELRQRALTVKYDLAEKRRDAACAAADVLLKA